jgi:hypothetical protein
MILVDMQIMTTPEIQRGVKIIEAGVIKTFYDSRPRSNQGQTDIFPDSE